MPLDLKISANDLIQLKQNRIDSIELTLYVAEEDNYETLLTFPPIRLNLSLDLSEYILLAEETLGLSQPQQVVVMDGSVRVFFEAAKLGKSSINKVEIPVLVQNDSPYVIDVAAEYLSVDGYMSPKTTLFCVGLPPGKKYYDFIGISNNDLALAGISEPTEMEFRLKFREAAGSRQTLHITDIQKIEFGQKSQAFPMVEAFHHAGVTVFLQISDEQTIRDRGILLTVFVDNQSDQIIKLYITDGEVNGKDAFLNYLPNIAARKIAVATIPSNGEQRFEKISFRIVLSDPDLERLLYSSELLHFDFSDLGKE